MTLLSASFSKLTSFFKIKIFQEQYQSVKRFGPRSGPTLTALLWVQTVCKVVSRGRKSPPAWKELPTHRITGLGNSLVPSYLRVPQAAGQVKILIFLVKITFFPLYANKFCDAGQVPILRYFEAWNKPP